jgi:hypothetical protein
LIWKPTPEYHAPVGSLRAFVYRQSEQVMKVGIGFLCGLALVLAAACGGGSGSQDVVDNSVTPDVADVPDALPDAVPDVLPTDVEDDADAPVTPDAPDVKEIPPLPLKAPLVTPADPLLNTGKVSCSVYQQARCEGGAQQVCGVYDTATSAFVAEPDPLLRRVLLFERWRDLYSSPDGLTSEIVFNAATPPGTPESEWSSPDRVSSQEGMGDSGIWTGWTVVGNILRYSQTGTDADYERMEKGVRTLLTMYDVTGVPGYFIRYYFALLPEGAPKAPDHIVRYEGSFTLNHQKRDVAPEALAQLPAIYRDGITDSEGKNWPARAMWQGRPSIDQNTGPMNALPMAYSMLRDDALKQRISHHLTCYLKRLQRIEVINLQQNPDLMASLMSYFNAGELMVDPGDLDFTKLDRLVAYVQRQINTANEETFDRSCPANVQLVPWRTIDAASDTFLGDFLELFNDMDTSAGGENQIDHYYFPNLRGGDAVHLMHLAAMAYQFTGEEQYRTFLFDEVIGNMKGLEVAFTAGAFEQPKFCSHFFGEQLTYGSWWVLLGMLGDSDLKTQLQQAFHDEMWSKMLRNKGNADFYLMYAGEVPDAIATGKQEALTYALTQLATMGGNGFVDGQPLLDDPRRAYTLTPEFVLANAPEAIEAVCPTQREFELCTTEVDFMGLKIPGQNLMDYTTCNEADPWQCKLPNDKCTDKMSNDALPVGLRQYTDWLWQRNPYALRKGVGLEGGVQEPGADLSEPYWNARRYGFITQGAGQVLAWETTGTCD